MIMKRYFYIGFLLFLLGCQKEGIVEYNLDKDCLQFDYSSTEMSFSYNFADQYIEIQGQWGIDYYFLGDSLQRDTISLNLSLIGWEGAEDRTFKLKTVPLVELDTLPMATVEFLEPYTFKANQLKDTIQIVIVRPEARGRYGAGITFDVEGEDAIFDIGAEEKQVYELYISDSYEKPTDWDRCVAYLGEYSEEKYAFMVSVLHIQFNMYYDWGPYNITLREELAKYNAEHPDNPKDFEFPLYAKPNWWDWSVDYLGEYSWEKEVFMKEVLPEGVYGANTDWSFYNKTLCDELAAYNEANPENPKDFTFPVLSSEPDWWQRTAQPYLGDYSDEKRDFIINEVFHSAGIWNESTPWVGFKSRIVQVYNEWNETHPDDPLPFTFPE